MVNVQTNTKFFMRTMQNINHDGEILDFQRSDQKGV